jgi:hypothetical protein
MQGTREVCRALAVASSPAGKGELLRCILRLLESLTADELANTLLWAFFLQLSELRFTLSMAGQQWLDYSLGVSSCLPKSLS